MTVDQVQRQKAIDHTRSFIVQAPAGSGKTELLTQRVLKLLAVVDNPEEVVAITFTNKAAREMQNRILQSLYSAQGPEPQEAHKLVTWQLAQAVLERDHQLGWDLMQSPHRLRIKTFDSLCATIANQMPVLARFGGQLSPLDRPQELYHQAAKAVVDGIKTNEPWAEHVYRVLAHTDNKVEYLQQLLAQQLAKRDQWLRLQQEGRAERAVLEQGFAELLETELKQTDWLLPDELKEELLSCLLVAADYLDEEHELAALKSLVQWPAPTIDHLAQWKAIASFCLTKDGKKLRKAGQMPAQTAGQSKEEKALLKQKKQQATELLAQLAEIPQVTEQLGKLYSFPNLHYQETEWQVIESLTELMRVAIAALKVEFKQQGAVDFTEIAMAADRALGAVDEPTELALKLDYAISHILVDEFQDTSYSQFQLIEKLTAGWQAGDGRTLFLVGDPMQSIYRFREANVGLFIQAREQGIGDIKPKFLQLSSNFRSSAAIVDWVNKSFASIFPSHDDSVLGAVSLAEAVASKSEQDSDWVKFDIFFAQSEDAATQEANHIAQQVAECLQHYPEQDIAILVRARTHAVAIIEALQKRSIAYVAEELEQLTEKQSVIDMMTLLRVLLHPLDKVAWLALFKTPWFGLSLQDMTLLEEHFGDKLYRALTEYQNIDGLSQSARQCLQKQGPVIEKHRRQLYQQPLASQLEALWLHLGGPLTVQDNEIEQVYSFLDFVSEYEQKHLLTDYQSLLTALSNLYAPPTQQDDCRVSIMTMHKSKGLEFDTVFLPHLHKGGGNGDKQLLVWEEFPAENEHSQYLMAPIDQSGDRNSLYKLVNQFSRDKDRLESARLLYVAATRAKRRLYLSCCAKAKYSDKEESLKLSKFSADSLMQLLHPIYETRIESELMRLEAQQDAIDNEPTTQVEQGWQRLRGNWHYPVIANPLQAVAASFSGSIPEIEQATIEFDWATDVAKTIGVLMHRQLELISKGVWQLSEANIHDYVEKTHGALLRAGYDAKNAAYARDRIREGLLNVLTDDTAQWILSPEHQESACELALTGEVNGDYKAFVIDRTFVDDQGVRWIIDYKTGSHQGDGVADFLASERQRYQPQLEQYKVLMERIDSRPIKLALYFPMMKTLEILE